MPMYLNKKKKDYKLKTCLTNSDFTDNNYPVKEKMYQNKLIDDTIGHYLGVELEA